MAKRTIPARVVEVCDHPFVSGTTCGKEGYLIECWVCTAKFCLAHRGIVPGSFGYADLCVSCARRDDVVAICDEYAEMIVPILKERDSALRRLSQPRIDRDDVD